MSGGERVGAWERERESNQDGVPTLPRAHAPTRSVDPITLEVVRSALYSIADEMRVIVMRSARSPLLKEAGDLSCVLTDAQGRLVAQGQFDNPMHLGTMCFTVKELLRRVPVERMRPGDVFFTNDPACGGNHLPDVKAIQPVFVAAGPDRSPRPPSRRGEGEHATPSPRREGGRGERLAPGDLVAFAVSLCHWPDIGGALPGSYVTWATDIHQEGLIIPPIRLFDAAGPTAALELVLANVRAPVERRGDVLAQAASTRVAAERLGGLFERYGVPTMLGCFDRFMDESDTLMRAALREVPDGVYRGEDFLDDDGLVRRPIRIAVEVTVEGDRARFDFSGSDPQARGPVNTTSFITCSGVFYACKALLGPDVPPNEGCYRALEVIVPPGSVLNAGPDAPVVGGNHETSQRVADAVFRALAPALPQRMTAGGITTSGLAILTGRRPDGRPWVLYETHGGGEGARSERDGTSAVRVHMSNVMNTPTEVIEAEYPLLVELHELREGSGGAGRRRGGLGLRRAYRVLEPAAALATMLERCDVPPWGLFGGADGLPCRVTLLRGAERLGVRGKQNLALEPGDVVLVETAGGGGYGDPAGRPPELSERDEREGYTRPSEGRPSAHPDAH